jgi:hypothetical protein
MIDSATLLLGLALAVFALFPLLFNNIQVLSGNTAPIYRGLRSDENFGFCVPPGVIAGFVVAARLAAAPAPVVQLLTLESWNGTAAAEVCLFAAVAILHWAWKHLFFDWGATRITLLCAAALLGSAIALEVMYARGGHWTSLGLCCPLAAQCCLVSIPVESKSSSLLPTDLTLTPAVRFFDSWESESASRNRKSGPRGSALSSSSKQ